MNNSVAYVQGKKDTKRYGGLKRHQFVPAGTPALDMSTIRKNDWIRVFGAQEHNLKNIDVAIPKGKLTIITGPSGSGKSSLALDILFVEGKRRYMESLSSYARQFLGIVKKPQVDRIEGLCPSIAIEQKTVGSNPRSTVGTVTEIYDYLRVLFARIGKEHCPQCMAPIVAQSVDSITSMVMSTFEGKIIVIAASIAHQKKGEFVTELTALFQAGISRFKIDGEIHKISSIEAIKALQLKKTFKHTIDAFIDTIDIEHDERARVAESIETAFKHADGICKVIVGDQEYMYSSHRMCVDCKLSFPELEPRLFSFNSPIGACDSCHGLGTIHQTWGGDSWWGAGSYADDKGSDSSAGTVVSCADCHGMRLNAFARAVTIGTKNVYQLCELSLAQLLPFLEQLKLDETDQKIGSGLIQEIGNRLRFLHNVGLDYLTLNRPASTLSGGEGQRIRLATQIGSSLSGVLYILDEPSIGLHQRDNDRLIATLHALRDQDNTVVVVEHDTDTMWQSDYVIDMGPAAGVLGGRVMAAGTPEEVARNTQSLTGDYLSGRRAIRVPAQVRKVQKFMTLKNVNKNNLRNITVALPLGVLCGISGVSGSGKSTLIMQELVPALLHDLGGYARKYKKREKGDRQTDLQGADSIENVVIIDQTPIGRTPRSNPATYLGIFDEIRKLYVSLPESNARGYKVGRFSFNVPDGRCAECKGEGTVTVEMHFLPEVVMECKECKGLRYNTETLSIRYRGKSIADVLSMTAYEATLFFAAHTALVKRLQLMCDVGLDYIQLGQPSTTLSGGEAQRIKLVDELAKRGNSTLYILDEPTTGLHTHDIEKLLMVLNRLVDKGNSMLVIEHNLDVLKTADYLIDMGPEGGDEGGFVVAQGTPQEVAAVAESHTGRYLKPLLKK